MAVQPGGKEYNTFVGGIITEANELTFPPNASRDEQNFELYRDGSRQRRLGLDYEQNYATIDTTFTGATLQDTEITTYRWENVGNNASLVMLVVQIRNELWFADINAEPITTNLYNSGNPLLISGATTEHIAFSAVNGVLVCTNKNIDPFYITYDAAADSMTATTITVQGRDMFGVADGLAVNTRSGSITNSHRYNLYNQGWTATNVSGFFTSQSTYPSNADIQHLGKNSSDVFDAALLVKQYFGNSPAPKGSYIIDMFDRGASRQTASGLTGLAVDREEGRPTTSASYGQRIFYSGIRSSVTGADANSPAFGGIIFFTKVILSNADLGKCYQDADPASEHISDIIGSDGGFINIPEAKNILQLETTESSLVVIAENGVWEIYGDAGGFSATTYQVSKVTSIGCVGVNTVIKAEDSILYWSQGGIYTLSIDSVSGRLKPENISETSIQTLFNDISGLAKEHASGFFDPAGRKIVWLYNNDADFNGEDFRYKANKELVLDLALKAYYVRVIGSIGTNSPYVCGGNITDNYSTASTLEKVVVNNVDVVVSGENIVSGKVSRSRGSTSAVYVVLLPATSGNYFWTIASYRNANFLDWFSYDSIGVDANAFLHTGEDLFGDTQRKKQVPYITFHMKRTETGFVASGNDLAAENPSSCMVEARWDFSDHSNSGQQGASFQAYRLMRPYQPVDVDDDYNYGTSVISTKNKLRGRGKALSLYIATEAGKDLYLLGWGLSNTTRVAV